MPAAARISDPIGHSPTMNWLLAGLLAGAAIAVVGVAIIGTGGLAAVAIVGAGAAAGAGLGEAMSTMSWAPKEVTGAIAGICSINVFTNALPAARAHLDMILCSKHPGPPVPIATGSGLVYINGMPAARVDDKTGCGAVITKGSSNVFIGGGTVQTDTINPENLVPGWVHAALLVVGVGAAVVLAGPVIAVGGLVMGLAGGYGGGWLGGKIFGEGSDGQKWSAIAGSILGGWLGLKGAPGAWNAARARFGPGGAGSSAADMAALRAKYATEIDNVSTFKTAGVDRSAADSYLATAEGKQFIQELRAADPGADINTIYARAVDQLGTGSNLPQMQQANSPLLKIVPQGETVSPYSPFFTTAADLEAASKSGVGLSDYFGLPMKSHAAVYDIYEISPTGSTHVFANTVAPTTELGGLVSTPGGATQVLVPNRGAWSPPVHVGTIKN